MIAGAGVGELAQLLRQGRGCDLSGPFPCVRCEIEAECDEPSTAGCVALARAALSAYERVFGTTEAALDYALRDAEAALARQQVPDRVRCDDPSSAPLDDRTITEALPNLRLIRD